MGNVVVWIVWFGAAFGVPRVGHRGRLVSQPVLLGARADRKPRLARGPLPAALRGVRRGRAGARLRRRGDGDVPVRDRVPRRRGGRAVRRTGWHGWQTVGGDRRGRGDPRRGDRRDRDEGRRTALARGGHRPRRSAARRRSGACSSPTTCSRSRSPRSCCSPRQSAASILGHHSRRFAEPATSSSLGRGGVDAGT